MSLIGEQNRRFVTGIIEKYGQPVESALPGPELVLLQQDGEESEQGTGDVLVEISLLLQQLHREENPVWIGSTNILLENISRHLSYYQQAAQRMVSATRILRDSKVSPPLQGSSESSKPSEPKQSSSSSLRVESLLRETQRLQLLIQRERELRHRQSVERTTVYSQLSPREAFPMQEGEGVSSRNLQFSPAGLPQPTDSLTALQKKADGEKPGGLSKLAVSQAKGSLLKRAVPRVWNMEFPRLSLEGVLAVPSMLRPVTSRESVRLAPGAARFLRGSSTPVIRSEGEGASGKTAAPKLAREWQPKASPVPGETALVHREFGSLEQPFERGEEFRQLSETLARGVHSYFTGLRSPAPWERTVQQSQQLRLFTQWLQQEVRQTAKALEPGIPTLTTRQLRAVSPAAGFSPAPAPAPMVLAASVASGAPVWKQGGAVKGRSLSEASTLAHTGQSTVVNIGGERSLAKNVTTFQQSAIPGENSFSQQSGQELSSVRMVPGAASQMGTPLAVEKGSTTSPIGRSPLLTGQRADAARVGMTVQQGTGLVPGQRELLRPGQVESPMGSSGMSGASQRTAPMASGPVASVNPRPAPLGASRSGRERSSQPTLSQPISQPKTSATPSLVGRQPVQSQLSPVTPPAPVSDQRALGESSVVPSQAVTVFRSNAGETISQGKPGTSVKGAEAVPTPQGATTGKAGKTNWSGGRSGRTPFPARQTMERSQPPVKNSPVFSWRPDLAGEAMRIFRESVTTDKTPQKTDSIQPGGANSSSQEQPRTAVENASHPGVTGIEPPSSRGVQPPELILPKVGETGPQVDASSFSPTLARKESQPSRGGVQPPELTLSKAGEAAPQVGASTFSHTLPRTEVQPSRGGVQPPELTLYKTGETVPQVDASSFSPTLARKESQPSRGGVHPPELTLPKAGETVPQVSASTFSPTLPRTESQSLQSRMEPPELTLSKATGEMVSQVNANAASHILARAEAQPVRGGSQSSQLQPRGEQPAVSSNTGGSPTIPRLGRAFPGLVGSRQALSSVGTSPVRNSLSKTPQVSGKQTAAPSTTMVPVEHGPSGKSAGQRAPEGIQEAAGNSLAISQLPLAGQSAGPVSLENLSREGGTRSLHSPSQAASWGERTAARAASFQPLTNGVRPGARFQQGSPTRQLVGNPAASGSGERFVPATTMPLVSGRPGEQAVPVNGSLTTAGNGLAIHRGETPLVNRQQPAPVREEPRRAPKEEVQMEFRVLEKKQREQSGNLERQSRTLRSIQQQLQQQGEQIRQLASSVPQNGGQQLPNTQQMVSQVMREIQRQLHFERQRRGG